MAGQATEPTPPGRQEAPPPNPFPLSASQEAQIREMYYGRVRQHCAEEIKAFAACASGRTVTISFACRAQNQAMNGCMTLHATQNEYDAARQEWFATRAERQRRREAKAKVAAAQEEFMHDWWGLPEDVRLSRKKEAERKKKSEAELR